MSPLKWWQTAVFYQVYPRSFADGNGDGIGDFPGITQKLDYLHALGIGAIWLSPHFPSPFLDCGYDVSDYQDVAPEYGTLEDFRVFLGEAHARGIRVILDLVLNHTSDQHPWFIESRSSRENPKRDWYIWRDGRDGGPPNNWASIFTGSAWQFDPQTGQYYYHAFLKEQPDLNWRNPQVKQAMWDMVRFWLDMGVDGFRLDAIGTIYEDPALPDHTLPRALDDMMEVTQLPFEEYETLMRHQTRQPGVHELMQELRALVDEYPGDRVLVGEDEDFAFHGSGDNELHLVFNFPLMREPHLQPAAIRANQQSRLAALPQGAWPCNTLGNHDSPRIWTRYGDGQNDAALARLHLALMLTLKGTPFLYYGEEIGMENLALSEASQLRDTTAANIYTWLLRHTAMTPEEAFQVAAAKTRDRCRSPFQWSAAPNAGFCPAEVAPWLPAHPNHVHGVNAAHQEQDPGSLLHFYRALLHLRRATPALHAGEYVPLLPAHEHVLAFLRQDLTSRQTCLVMLNFSNQIQKVSFEFAANPADPPRVLFSSAANQVGRELTGLQNGVLHPFEVRLLEIIW